jgi:hypothetical protein
MPLCIVLSVHDNYVHSTFLEGKRVHEYVSETFLPRKRERCIRIIDAIEFLFFVPLSSSSDILHSVFFILGSESLKECTTDVNSMEKCKGVCWSFLYASMCAYYRACGYLCKLTSAFDTYLSHIYICTYANDKCTILNARFHRFWHNTHSKEIF